MKRGAPAVRSAARRGGGSGVISKWRLRRYSSSPFGLAIPQGSARPGEAANLPLPVARLSFPERPHRGPRRRRVRVLDGWGERGAGGGLEKGLRPASFRRGGPVTG